MTRRYWPSVSLNIIAIATLANAAPAVAADNSIDDGMPVEGEITVTARRVAESLSDVPATVQVFTADTLTSASIQKTEDFIALTPGVSIVSGAAEPADPQINIRGVSGVRDAEPSVALSVDGIIKTDVSALNQDQGDLVQIEVLKGPQGAIYGRNATSGAFIMTTRKPGDRLEGRFRASYQEDDTQSLFASLSGPLAEGVGLLVSGSYYHTRGQYQITSPVKASDGRYMDPSEEYNVNGRLVLEPSDRLTLDLKGHYGHREGGSIVYNAVFSLPAYAPYGALFDEDANDHEYLFDTNIVPKSWLTTKEASIKADYDLDNVLVTAWLSYAKSNRDLYSDGTSAGFGFFSSSPSCISSFDELVASGYQLAAPQYFGTTPDSSLFGPYTPTQCDGIQYQRRIERDLSGEVRISGTSGAVEWMAGAYYLDINREVAVAYAQDTGNGVLRTPLTDDPLYRTEQLSWDHFDTRAYAVFGSLDWKATDTVTVSAALRYDNERRKVHNLLPTDFLTQYVDFDGAPYTGGAPLNPGLLNGPIPDQARTFDQVEPKVSVTWKPESDFSIYANYGKGFKSGGFNTSGAGAIIDTAFNQTIDADINITDNYAKETSDAFEIGFKKNFGPKLAIEGAGYYTRVKNMQFFEFFVGSFGILRVVSDIDRVDLWGGELSVNYRITPEWSVFAAGNVTGSEIKKNTVRADTVGNKSPYTPDYTLNFGSQLELPLTDGISFVGRTDVRVTGPTWFSTVQDQLRPTIFGADGEYGSAQREAFTTVNLRAGIKGDGWEVAFIASNLFNEKYLEEVLPAPEFGGSFVSPAQRRRIGAEVIYRF